MKSSEKQTIDKMTEYEEIECSACEGKYASLRKVPYLKNAKEVGYVGCKYCMDTGVTRRAK